MASKPCRKHFDVWVKMQVSQVGRKRKREKSKIHFCHGVGASNIKSQCGAESNILHAFTHRPWFPLWEIWLLSLKTLFLSDIRQWSHTFSVIKKKVVLFMLFLFQAQGIIIEVIEILYKYYWVSQWAAITVSYGCYKISLKKVFFFVFFIV